MKDNDVILADPLKHKGLIEDMRKLAEDSKGPLEYTAGGAGLNSLRCAQVIYNYKYNYIVINPSFSLI